MPNYYSQQYFKVRNHLDLHLAETIKFFMLKHNLTQVLDVGCGTGRLVKFLNNAGLAARGCDNHQQAIYLARKLNGQTKIKNCSATKLAYQASSFDLITCISVIEHLTEVESKIFIKEASRVLKNSGYIFIVTPNLSSPLRLILGKCWFGYADPMHINFFSPKSLTNLLKRNGLRDIQVRFHIPFNLPFTWPLPKIFGLLPNQLKQLINYLLISSSLSTFRDSFWMAAKK